MEETGQLPEAFELSREATGIEPRTERYAKRLRRLKATLDQQDALREKVDSSPLTPDMQRELDEFYWHTDIGAAELEEHFNLSKAARFFVTPLLTNTACPNCDWKLVYKTRSARKSGDQKCDNCDHIETRFCRCAHCTEMRGERERQRQEELHNQKRSAYESRLKETSSESWVSWALSKLNRRERIFLRAFIEVVTESESPTWECISDRAGVVSHKKYLGKLVNLGLLLEHPEGGIAANPSVNLELIKVEKRVRSIPKSRRFDVFQRDHHTCQYCGRKAPDVELEIDHLIPVAEGGTDDFDNLVTSCADCNRGKSAKLIEEFTEGHSIEDWRDFIRQKRSEVLRNRRSRLPEVKEYWAECRGMNNVSDYDEGFIENLIERYEPDWIWAIFITNLILMNLIWWMLGI